MDLLERLRPKWRHPDAQVRRAALRTLDDIAALEQVAATDPEPALREAATTRLFEVWQATAMSAGPASECIAAAGRLDDPERLVAIAMGAAHPEVRTAALVRISGDRWLREVVRGATDSVVRAQALERIADTAVLRALAVGDAPAAIVVRAVERIADPDVLRAIAEHPHASKAARHRARALVPNDRGEPVAGAPKDVRARQLELSLRAEALRADRDALAAAAEVRALEHEWDALVGAAEPHPEVAERFSGAAAAILAAAAVVDRRRLEADHAVHAFEENLAARERLCATVEGLSGAEGHERLADARAAWARLAPLPDDRGAHVADRFARAVRECKERLRAWDAAEAAHAARDAVLTEAEALADITPPPSVKTWRALERRWRMLVPDDAAGDDVAAARARFGAAAERLEQRRREFAHQKDETQHANLTRLTALATRAEELVGAEVFKLATARRALEGIDRVLDDLGPLPPGEARATWVERLGAAQAALRKRLAEAEETEEWRRWANATAQEEIIARVEAILDANDLLEGTKLLAALPAQWDAVATATSDKAQALWERFRTARNDLRRRCDAFLEENLARKRGLVEQAAALGDSTAWNETADALRKLQAEWKAIGPVPVKISHALWREFRAPCDRFFTRRQEHFAKVDAERGEHAKAKEALCAQAEALADSTDWEATATALKALQAEWKRGGAPPRAQAEALWQRFRAACDRFFDRHRRRGELARDAEVAKAEALCADVEALVASLGADDAPGDADAGQRLDAAWGEWIRLDAALLGDVRALDERLRVACEQLAAARPGALAGTRLDPATTHARREKLCGRLEALAPAAEAPKASLQEMALALRERLATNTMVGGRGTQPAKRPHTPEDVERILAGWARLGPVLGDDARALAERFAEAQRRLGRSRS